MYVIATTSHCAEGMTQLAADDQKSFKVKDGAGKTLTPEDIQGQFKPAKKTIIVTSKVKGGTAEDVNLKMIVQGAKSFKVEVVTPGGQTAKTEVYYLKTRFYNR